MNRGAVIIGRARNDHEVAPWRLFFASHQLADRPDRIDDGCTGWEKAHLLESHIRPTFEVVLTESPAHLKKEFDPIAGIALIKL